MSGFEHITVLAEKTVDQLSVKKDGLYVDFTLGGGGHSLLILQRGGRVIGIDRDMAAIEAGRERLKEYGDRFIPVHDNFGNIENILKTLGADKPDGIVADLGVSSPQLDVPERGFSYMHDAPLDMRMDLSAEKTAYDVVNGYSEAELFRVISRYGEERWASRIADFIVKRRQEAPISTTFQLVDVIKAAIPAGARKDGPHPAKRTFQAIRIEVNGELEILDGAVRAGVSALKKGGRMAVITFHSLEDRIVKTAFAELERGCTCPKDFPVCVCGGVRQVKVLTRKPIVPDREELTKNPRARSSKLRAVEKISD